MTQPALTDRYFALLDLPDDGVSAAHKAALSRAHELRKFEIENYWRRSSYFWGFQLVSFGALALVAKDGRFYPPFVLIVAVLGALAALTGVLTARGSKFWQENWEAHVDFLEGGVEGHLHTTALAKGPLRSSVSRVNERFLLVLLAGWILAFLTSAAVLIQPDLMKLAGCPALAVQIGMPLAVLVGGSLCLLCGTKSNLRGRAYRLTDLEPLGAIPRKRVERMGGGVSPEMGA